MNFIKSIFRIIKSVILTLILVCLVIFMVNNRETVLISLYPLPFEIETKVFLVMIFFFLFGLLFGLIAWAPHIISRAISKRQDKKQIQKLEKQVAKKQ